MKEKILTSAISIACLKATKERLSTEQNEAPPLHPDRNPARVCGSQQGACAFPGPRPQHPQVCGAPGPFEAPSCSSWEGTCFLAAQSVSGMNNPWRSRCISTSTDARASSVKVLASRISRKGGFWGSVETIADKIIPLGKKEETLCKSVTLNFLQLEGVSQLCMPVLFECK